MASIHDSLLTGYTVDGHGRTMIFHTEQHAGGGEQFIDVRFRGVVAYHFEGDCLHNIVGEFYEVLPEQIVGDGLAFAERNSLYGWPVGWDRREETASDFLRRIGARVFELETSYGMWGWVAAESIEYIVVEPPA